MNKALTLLSLLSIVSGCIAIPLPPEKEPFTEKETEFINLGVTSKDDVEQNLGPPSNTYRDGEYWVLRSSRSTGRWLAIPALPTAGGGGGVIEDIVTYMLMIGFGDDGTVRQVEVKHGPQPCFGESRICLLDDFLEFSPTNIHNQFEVKPGSCAVFLYSSTPIDDRGKRRIVIDGADRKYRKLLRNLYDEIYVRVELPGGSHKIEAVTFLAGEVGGFIHFDCVAGESSFLQVNHPQEERASIVVVTADAGREELLGRRQSIPKD